MERDRRHLIRASIMAVLLVFPLFVAGLSLLGVDRARVLFFGYIAVLSLSAMIVAGSRVFLLREFEQGMTALAHARWEQAIHHFESYLGFLGSNPLFDEYHWLFMLTAAPYSLTEMTLCNLGYAHAQLDHTEYALGFYRRALEHNPANRAARAALDELEDKAHA